MNPIFKWIVTHTAGTQRRRCPGCGRTQSVSARERERTVTCERCGAAIPPPAP